MRLRAVLVPVQEAAAGAENLADGFQGAPDAQVEIVFGDDVLEEFVDGAPVPEEPVHVRLVLGRRQEQVVAAGVLEHPQEGVDVAEVPAAVGQLAREFQQAVKSHRPNLDDKVDGILNGRMFFAKDALKYGLIDAIGNRDAATEEVRRLAASMSLKEYAANL